MLDRSKNIFAEFACKKIASLLAEGREGTAATYTSSVRSFMRFLEAENVELRRMDEMLMERYEAWLLRNGVLKNTSSFYLRTLRTICRQAAYASTFPHCSMKSREYLWPKTKRLVKDERRSKSKLRVCA